MTTGLLNLELEHLLFTVKVSILNKTNEKEVKFSGLKSRIWLNVHNVRVHFEFRKFFY